MAWLDCFHPVGEHRVTKAYTLIWKKHGLNKAHWRFKLCWRDEQSVLSACRRGSSTDAYGSITIHFQLAITELSLKYTPPCSTENTQPNANE